MSFLKNKKAGFLLAVGFASLIIVVGFSGGTAYAAGEAIVTTAKVTATSTPPRFVAILGDTVILTWDNTTTTGDGNANATSVNFVKFDFSEFAPGVILTLTTTTVPNVWTATTTIDVGSKNGATANGYVLASNDGGGTYSASSTGIDSTNLQIDNVLPTITAGNLASSSATTVDMQITGTEFARFADSGNATATSSDLAKITYDGKTPQSAYIATSTQINATFLISDIGTGTSTSPLVMATGTVKDQGGNYNNVGTVAANAITDAAKPVLSSVSASSTNATPTLAKPGDTVNLTFTSSETIGTTTVVFSTGGVPVASSTTYASSSNVWTASYVAQSADTNGALTFTINFTDLAANSGTQVTATTTGSSVTFDKTVPTLSAVSASSTNATPTLAKPGDTVNLFYTSNETLSTSTVVFTTGGDPIASAVTYASSSNLWTASFVVASNATSGPVAFTISFKDSATNTGVAVTATTTGAGVTVDTVVPTITAAEIASSSAATVDIKIAGTQFSAFVGSGTATATSSDLLKITYNGLTPVSARVTSSTQINATFAIAMGTGTSTTPFVMDASTVKDAAGNANASTTIAANAVTDIALPILSSISASSTNANSALAKPLDTVHLTFTSSETIGTPTVVFKTGTVTVASSTTYASSSNVWTASYVAQSADTNGVLTFTINFTDLATNGGTQVTATTTGSGLTFDKTVPTVTAAQLASSTATTVDIRITGTEFITFASSSGSTANASDRANITFNGFNPTSAVIASSTQINATFSISAGTGTSTAVVVGASTVKGAAGNANASTTIAANDVTDIAAPRLLTVSAASNGTSTSEAQVGDTITITFTSSEALKVGTVTATTTLGGAGTDTVTIASSSATAWTASFVASSTNTEGALAFSLGFSDLGSVAGTAVTATTTGAGVTFDKTTPSTPVASPAAPATFVNTGAVSFSSTGSTSIRYRTDGVVPACSTGTLYSSAITITNSTTFQVTACDNSSNSTSTSFAYTVTGGGSSGGGGGGGYVPPTTPVATTTTPVATTTIPVSATSTVTVTVTPSGVVAPGLNKTNAELQTLITQLMAQLQTLIAQAQARGIKLPSGLIVSAFARNLTPGVTHIDVKSVQAYLNAHGFQVASSGAGSKGHETQYFGPATKKALSAFQASVGISPASGNFGPLTRNYLNSHP